MELDEEEDTAVFDWFYDSQPLKFSKMVNILNDSTILKNIFIIE